MKKTKKEAYICRECGEVSFQWVGRCPSCSAWNSLEKSVQSVQSKSVIRVEIQNLKDVKIESIPTYSSGIKEFDESLGTGVVHGAFILIGGEPGIGKSTLTTQVMMSIARKGKKVIYFSAEESVHQVKARAERLGEIEGKLYIVGTTSIDDIIQLTNKEKPDCIVVDSIQVIEDMNLPAVAGSVSQVRECASKLQRLAKDNGITVFLIGHITKDGNLAGPKVLEHIVDTVLQFELSHKEGCRILRTIKNRFGPSQEVSLFDMTEKGLFPINHPEDFFLENNGDYPSEGCVIVPILEGRRVLLVEVQALVTPNHSQGYPRRVSTFIDQNRLALLLAICEKKLSISFSKCDVFVNLAGGFKVSETALDLGIIIALVSSFFGLIASRKMVAFGEVGLNGEVRFVRDAERRVKEVEKLGFLDCILPNSCYDNKDFSLETVKLKKALCVGDILTILEIKK